MEFLWNIIYSKIYVDFLIFFLFLLISILELKNKEFIFFFIGKEWNGIRKYCFFKFGWEKIIGFRE